jgi:hypothetical protein
MFMPFRMPSEWPSPAYSWLRRAAVGSKQFSLAGMLQQVRLITPSTTNCVYPTGIVVSCRLRQRTGSSKASQQGLLNLLPTMHAPAAATLCQVSAAAESLTALLAIPYATFRTPEVLHMFKFHQTLIKTSRPDGHSWNVRDMAI